MDKESKKLFVSDIASRLPYGLICSVYVEDKGDWTDMLLTGVNYHEDGIAVFHFGSTAISVPEYVKPYLKSFTLDLAPASEWDDDKKSYNDLFEKDSDGNDSCETQYWDLWMLKHHYDFRNFTENGWTVRVTKENNPYK